MPTKKIFVVIHNSRYDKKRRAGGDFADLPGVIDDAVNAKKGMVGLGASIFDIRDYEDVNYKTFVHLFEALNVELYKNNSVGEKTLLFIYYAGHGIVDNMTFAVTNEDQDFPLEQNIRQIANVEGSYVVALFDCSRQRRSNFA